MRQLPAWLSQLRTRGPNTLLVLSLVLALCIVLPFAIVSRFSPKPYLVIDLTTETMQYRVQRPDLSGVQLVAAEWDKGPETCKTLGASNVYDGVLIPSAGVLVRYLWQPKKVAVQIKRTEKMATDAPIAELVTADGTNCKIIADTASFRVAPDGLRPLPILGPAEAGVEMSAAAAATGRVQAIYNLSYGGTLDIYGRTMNWPGAKGSLFKGQDTSYIIPPGSRLASSANLDGPDAENAEPWYGMATFTDMGFRISATVENNDLRLYRPGGQVETFAISIIGRIVNDPVLGWLFFGGTILAASLSVVSAWMGLWRAAPEPVAEPKRSAKPPRRAR